MRFKQTFATVCTLLFFASIIFFEIQPTKAIQNFSVGIQPQRIGSVSTYHFEFKIEKNINVHDYVKIIFPPGTMITPPLPEEPTERVKRLALMLDYIFFGTTPCGPCGSLPVFTTLPDGSLQLTIISVVNYDAKTDPLVKVTLFPQVGITNPCYPGIYTYHVATQFEKVFKVSAPVEIYESHLSNVIMSVSPNGFYQPATYKVSFTVGEAGKLKAGFDAIILSFPPELEFSKRPSTFRPEWIMINGSPLGSGIMDTPNELKITVPREINNKETVEVLIHKAAGFLNPKKPGQYEVRISTTADTTIKEASFTIVETNPMLRLSTEVSNQNTSCILQYIQDTPFKQDDCIDLLFPSTFEIPQTESSQYILVNGKKVDSVSSYRNLVSLCPGMAINQEEPVIITFREEFGIVNPKTPGLVIVSFKTKGASEYIQTFPLEIKPQKLEIQNITLGDPHAFTLTKYTIDVIFADNQIPRVGEKMYLDLGTGENIQETIVDSDLSKMYSLSLWDTKNPKAGKYQAIFYFADQRAYFDYYIFPAIPESNIILSEGARGKNDWWTKPPTLTIETRGEDVTVFYYWEATIDGHITELLPYFDPMMLFPGQYKTKLHYYAINAYGVEREKVFDMNVDTISPQIEITEPRELRTMSREKIARISGRSIESKTMEWGKIEYTYDQVFINENEILVSKRNGKFSFDLELKEGVNSFQLSAEDEAGNRWEKTYIIICDTIPPDITIINPVPGATVVKNPLIIEGITDPANQLQINGEEIWLKWDGSFRIEYKLSMIGENWIHFVTIDEAGNETKKDIPVYFGYTIILQIGNRKAVSNGVKKEMPLAPLIQKGKTLVPFRFIGEELKAKISYTLDKKTNQVQTVSYEKEGTKVRLTIGGKKAFINQREVMLDVPAQIIQGHTIIPLRFVSEGLGCGVTWNPKNQIITVFYQSISKT